MNLRAIFEARALVLFAVAAVMLAMASLGDLWRPIWVVAGLGVGGGVAVLTEDDNAVTEALDDVPPAAFALVGIALAWGGADYTPAISISAFAGLATGHVVTATVLRVFAG